MIVIPQPLLKCISMEAFEVILTRSIPMWPLPFMLLIDMLHML